MGSSAAKPLQPQPAEEEIWVRPRRRRWKLWLALLVLLLLIGLAAGELTISSLIQRKLIATMQAKLDAELRVDRLLYVPPYGAIAFAPRVTRDGETVFQADRLQVQLAEFPAENKPLIILRLAVDDPHVLIDTTTAKKRQSVGGQPSKLSDVLRLDQLRINNGQIQWRRSRQANAAPMTWEGIFLSADMRQKSASSYAFHLTSRAHRMVETSAAGVLDVDSLLLELTSGAINLHAEPYPIQSPLPAEVQRWLQWGSINGRLTIAGGGTIPLLDPDRSAFAATISLRDARARIPKGDVPIDQASAELVCQRTAGGPIDTEVKKLELRVDGGKSLIIERGKLIFDPAGGKWSIADVRGELAFERARTTPRPATTPALAGSLAPAGRADITVSASGPLVMNGQDPWQTIDHEIVIYPRGLSVAPSGFGRRIESITGGDIMIRAGMLVCHELSATYGQDVLRLRSMRLPLDGITQALRFEEIASVSFQPPTPRYCEPIDSVLAALNPQGTFLIGGFYIVNNPGADWAQDFELLISIDSASLSPTSRKIPIRGIRGDATITPTGVEVQGLEAELLRGGITASGQWRLHEDGASEFGGDVKITDADLGKLDEVSPNAPRTSLSGKLTGQATFSGTIPNDDSDWRTHLAAAGELEIVNGNFFELPVLKQIAEAIRGLRPVATAGEAAAVFELSDGKVALRRAGVNSPMLGLQGSGEVTLDGQVKAEVVAAPLADWREKLRRTGVPIISRVVGDLAGAIQKMLNKATETLLYQFEVEGNVRGEIKVRPIPAPALTEPAAAVFERMIAPRREHRPLDWFEQQPRSRKK